ncbi:C-type lectin domain family 4 member A isoform X3 [Salmo salar]|uniref:C-type lectin domain family 4 member A isoform X3 n=1 Tax=Salmo salar TaxID=8030 RepID=A0ABM3EMX5_SALSA|nr:C-type lectin domain family 4 member A-like isoform X3 [Salmo salar]
MDDYINEEVIELNEIIEENENIAMRRVKTHRAGPKDSGRTLYRMVAVSFGMLCVLQVTLNISLRLSFSCSDKERDQIKACYNTTGLAQDRDQPNTSREKMCPEGWKKFGFNSCYYLSAEKKPWEYAEQDCLGRGAHLVIINSEEEQKFLNALRTISWIGLNERETWK